MRHIVLVTCAAAAVAVGSAPTRGQPAPTGSQSQAIAVDQATGRETQGNREQAKPRLPTPPPRPQSPPPRRAAPPPRIVPPSYYVPPHRYYFPPVSHQRSYYYHPYFGFYFGPYYGPYYPYPGPYVSVMRDAVCSIRTRVTPRETEIYVNGYYAGIADDFDGVFQRLYLPSGGHELEFRLDGYQTFRQQLYLSVGDSGEIVHQMRRLRPGEASEPPRTPRSGGEGWAGTGDRPASPFGVLVLRVHPTDALILVDEEVWIATDDRAETVIHVSSGTHRLEVRKAGYQSFVSEISLSEGATTRLTVTLTR